MKRHFSLMKAAFATALSAAIFSVVGVISLNYEQIIYAKAAFFLVCASVLVGFLFIVLGWLHLPKNFITKSFEHREKMQNEVRRLFKR